MTDRNREWYRGKGQKARVDPTGLPGSPLGRYTEPSGYLADDGLAAAVNVTLELGQPLLLTGEPGTGKTQLAYSVAWELGLEPVLKYETKSSSEARDLFYTYDALGRFNATQIDSEDADPVRFIDWNALGLAILYTNEPESVRDLRPPQDHTGKRRSLVLIDEIDKAPRDFPNDLLNEIEHMYFKVPELRGRKVEADPELHPILFLTSNSEKNLPGAFLRRCAFYHIPFPEKEEDLRRIVERRLGEAVAEREVVSDALDLFATLRGQANLFKPPSTGELLAFLHVVTRDEGGSLLDPGVAEQALTSMIKVADDRKKARGAIEAWARKKRSNAKD